MIKDLISIIVPVYQGERYIANCLQSIQKQSYSKIEIIVVNDGSTDSTQIIIQEKASLDDRIVLVNQENAGVSEARNTGIKVASGEYIMFVDSDDEIENELCTKLMDAMHETNADIVVSGFTFVNKNLTQTVIFSESGIFDKKDIIKNFPLMNNTYIYQNVCAKLYKSEMLKICKFDNKIRLGEDLMYNYQVYKYVSKLCVISYSGYRYFINEQSATHIFNNTDFEKQKNIWCSAMDYFNNVLNQYGESECIDKTYVGNSINIITSLVTTECFKEIFKYLPEYLNDDFFQKKLQMYVADDKRMKVKAFLCKRKCYIKLYLFGKLNYLRRKMIF